MEEGPIKDGFVSAIGSYMKLAYKTWNKEHYVSDDIIKTDLLAISDGKLSLDDDASISNIHYRPDNRDSRRNDKDRGRNDRRPNNMNRPNNNNNRFGNNNRNNNNNNNNKKYK